MEWDITRLEPVFKTWCAQIKFLQGIVIGLYFGLYKEENISLPGGEIVGPPYWQIKQINPFFILNPFSYHKIMKIQIPPSSQILNCTHNITPGLKRKRGREKKKKNLAQACSPRECGSSALCFEFPSLISNSSTLWAWSTAPWVMSGGSRALVFSSWQSS